MSTRRLCVAIAIVVGSTTWFVVRPSSADGAYDDRVRWRATLKHGPSELAADARGVAVTTSGPSVYLLGSDGKVQWRVEYRDAGATQPALGADVVAVGTRHSVAAFARSDGSLLWAHPSASTTSVTMADDTVLAGDDDGTLTAFDARTGDTRWSAQHPGGLWSQARVDVASGSVVANWRSDAPAVRVLDLSTGALRWEAPIARFTAVPAVHAGRVVLAIGDGNRHARVEARDLRTGARQWQTRVPASFESGIEPAVDDRAVAVVDHFGVVTVLDPATGKLRWHRDTADVLLKTRVVLTKRWMTFTSYAGMLRVLDRRDGHLVQEMGPDDLGGLPVATEPAPWRPGGLLVAIRLRDTNVQLRRLP